MPLREAVSGAVLALVLAAGPAAATFHTMQIEQVIGGVDGDASVQAIQLRTRSGGQNLVSQARLYARDAAGTNAVLLLDFPSDVADPAAGVRILAATASFSAHTTPTVTPDFVLTSPIPETYLSAGSLTFEDDFGTVYWRLSWGGASYTGSGAGVLTNDADGNFSPPFPNPLPSTSGVAVLFQGAHTAPSTNNAADYALTVGPATFFNATGGSGTVQSLVAVGDAGLGTGIALSAPQPNPVRSTMAYSVTLAREAQARVEVFDAGGRRLERLLDAALPAGRHGFTWDATSGEAARLPSGVYLLGLSVEGVREVRRFVLLR
jgi:hypothetical protein